MFRHHLMSLPRLAFCSSLDEEKRPQEFSAKISDPTKVYSPEEPLQFNNEGKYRVYECNQDHFYVLSLAGSAYFLYKLAFKYTGLTSMLLPFKTLLLLISYKKFVRDAIVKHLDLLKDGMYVEVVSMNGTTFLLDIQ